MDSRDEALIVVRDWLEKGVPAVQPKAETKKPPRPIATELSTAQIISELKNAELSPQDVVKIEKVLKEKGLINLIVRKDVRKDAPEAEALTDYLDRFWDYSRSPYVEEKLSHKVSIGKAHTSLSRDRVKLYWSPYFKGKLLGEITREDIMAFSVDLAKNNPTLSPLTLKQILRVGVTALRWAAANKLIPEDPTQALPSYSSKARKRGVLSPQEAKALFSLKWKDERYMLVNLIAMTTRLRIGEILAIHTGDIGEEYLNIEWSYSIKDGLKSTKTDEPRLVLVILQIQDAMLRLGQLNPHGDGFVFFGEKPNQPFDQHEPLKALKRALVQLRVGENANAEAIKEAEEYWKKRRCALLHSWRHFSATRMTDKLEARKVMLATGHKTEAVFKGYADHALETDLGEVAITTGEVFGGLLPESISGGNL